MFPKCQAESSAVRRAHSARAVHLSAEDTVVHEQILERVTVVRAQAAALAPSLIPLPPTGAWGIHTPHTKMLGRAWEENNGEQAALQDLRV